MPGVVTDFRGLPTRLRAIDGFLCVSLLGGNDEFSDDCMTLVVLGIKGVGVDKSETLSKWSCVEHTFWICKSK